MRRGDTKRIIKRTGDVRKDLTQNQLAWIASVALAYNETEQLIDGCLIFALSLGDISYDVLGRINGLGGKAEILKKALVELNCPNNMLAEMRDSIGDGGFLFFKKYRDRIIHARVIDAAAAIAKTPAKRGNFEEVLLTVAALKALYIRLTILRKELIEIMQLVGELARAKYLKPIEEFGVLALNDQHIGGRRKVETALIIRDCFTRFQIHRNRRLSLPPLPEFPAGSVLRAADEKALQVLQDNALSHLGPMPEYLKKRRRLPLSGGFLGPALDQNNDE